MVLMNWIWKYSPLQPAVSFLNWFACAFLMVVSYGVITILLMYCCTKGMRGMVPVSYTHLDVYKRQVHEKESGSFMSCKCCKRISFSLSHIQPMLS